MSGKSSRSTWFGLRPAHWGVVVVLAVLQVLATGTSPATGSNARSQGELVGRFVFALLVAAAIVFLLTRLYLSAQRR